VAALSRLVLSTAVVLLMANAPASGQESVEQGRAIAVDRCSRCHAVGLDDVSRNAQAPQFRTLGARYPLESLAEALAEGIVTGHPDMPQFEFTPAEIGQFLDYLGDLNTRAGTVLKSR
jgi:mono/diheme cytochrome c family protein